MTHRSDTLKSMPSTEADAAILRRVAATALDDSRAAWKEAHERPTAASVRAAFRSCVFAARALRRAAGVLPSEAQAMRDAAGRLDVAAGELKAKLVAMPGWTESTTPS